MFRAMNTIDTHRLYSIAPVTEREIQNCLIAAGIHSNIKDFALLTGGAVHTSIHVVFDDGSDSIVIRINERKNCISREAQILKQLSPIQGISVPRLIYCDTSCSVLNREYMIIGYIPGCDLHTYLAEKHRESIVQQVGFSIGKVIGVLHSQRINVNNAVKYHLKKEDAVAEKILGKNEYQTLYSKYGEDFNSMQVTGIIHGDLQPSNIRIDTTMNDPKISLLDLEFSGLGARDIDLARAEESLFGNWPGLKESFFHGYRMFQQLSKVRKCAFVYVILRMLKGAWATRNESNVNAIKSRLMRYL